MQTEELSPRFRDLDSWPSGDILAALYEGQLAAAAAVLPVLPAIAAAAEDAVKRLAGEAGRLVYVGAGTSGRIGIQDGSELSPTFDWPEDRVVFSIAGGERAILRAVEKVEDSVEDGSAAMENAGVGKDDVVIGVAASGTTPYTIAALEAAGRRGALTIGLANNAGAPLLSACRHPILMETGAEVVAGSTRMKAGTAQKIVLNLLSTLIMIRLGRVYGGHMVHMRINNAKLRRRSAAMVASITGCDEPAAYDALDRADGDVRLAAMIALGSPRDAAEAALGRNSGNLRAAMAELGFGEAKGRRRG